MERVPEVALIAPSVGARTVAPVQSSLPERYRTRVQVALNTETAD